MGVRLFFILLLAVAVARAGASITDFHSVPQASSTLAQLGKRLQRQADRRSLFTNVYSITIANTWSALKNGEFRRPRWIERLVLNYANIYRRTLAAELAGKRDRLPTAWQDEFRYIENTHAWSSEDPGGALWSASLDLINGIHVHITRDLVEALLVTQTDFDSTEERADFLHVTEILRRSMPAIWVVFEKYNQEIGLGPTFDQYLVINWISKLRVQAWIDASGVAGETATQRRIFLDSLDQQVAAESRSAGVFQLF